MGMAMSSKKGRQSPPRGHVCPKGREGKKRKKKEKKEKKKTRVEHRSLEGLGCRGMFRRRRKTWREIASGGRRREATMRQSACPVCPDAGRGPNQDFS
jgi:hypothetical protein